MSGKRCGTCVSRKIRCDRQSPVCSQCSNTGRKCSGYGLRLSWPRPNDRRRHVLGPVPSNRVVCRRAKSDKDEALHFIDVTDWDIGLHRYMTTADRVEKAVVAESLRLSLSWLPSKWTTGEKQLFEYFQVGGSRNITSLSDKPLGGLLMRIALSDNGPAGVAVQRSMLALSSYLKNGDSFQTQRIKLSAIQALAAAAHAGVSPHSATQHLSAGLLLCMLEIYSHTETSYQWISYVLGARNIVATMSTDWPERDTDVSDLCEWLFHYEVLAQFSRRHWKPHLSAKQRMDTTGPASSVRGLARISPPLGGVAGLQQTRPGFNDALQSLSDVIEAVLPPSDPRSQSANYKDRIRQAKDTIESQIPAEDLSAHSSEPKPESSPEASPDSMSRLYRISSIIYLSRASGDHIGAANKVGHLARSGLRLLGSMTRCTRPFPILIIGLEARTDEDRKLVLDLIRRTEDDHADRRMLCLRDKFLQTLWNQDDLQAAGEVQLGYFERLTAVMSLGLMIPAFA